MEGSAIKFDHASESFKRLNPHLFVGSVEKPFTERNIAQALDSISEARKRCEKSLEIRVTLTSYRASLLDRDNLIGGLKPLRDAIAASIGLDDSDEIITWEYHQLKTDGCEGTAVRIEML